MSELTPNGGWAEHFVAAGGLWKHDGNAARPHALLTSGLHSDGFVNGSLLIQFPQLLNKIVRDWSETIAGNGGAPDWVCGSAFGAITIAYEMASQLGSRAAFTEPVDGALTLKRFPIKEGDRVIVVEDVVTTGGSTLRTIEALEAAGATVAPEIYILVDRSDGTVLAPRTIFPATRVTVNAWSAEECPLCATGSEAVRAKANWDRLTAEY
jgi:orotate phosphoribosyltransferase